MGKKMNEGLKEFNGGTDEWVLLLEPKGGCCPWNQLFREPMR